jgi:hypothetical protein
LGASDDIVSVLGETDRSALAKARACASNQNSFFAHRLNPHKDMGTTSLEIVEDRSETCDEIKEHYVRNLLDPTTDARQVLAHKPRAMALQVQPGIWQIGACSVNHWA